MRDDPVPATAIDAIWNGSAEAIHDAFGLRVPASFLAAVRLVAAACSNKKELVRFFDERCSLLFGGPECRYPGTPPELFPFGSMGVDGVHYGFVVHAPELHQPEYPIGEYCPMDSGGVFLLGFDTANAFDMLFSTWLNREKTGGRARPKRDSLLWLASRHLGIEPSASKAHLRYTEDGNGRAIVPEVRPGWRHLPTSDGIGVLAPLDAFASASLASRVPPADTIVAAEQALAAGVPATALLLLREELWNAWHKRDAALLLLERMAETYEQLGRPELAKVCRASAERRRRAPVIKIPIPPAKPGTA